MPEFFFRGAIVRIHSIESTPYPVTRPWASLSRLDWSRLLTLANWPAILTGAGLFGLFAGLLAIIQFASPNLAGNDGYYHIKMAQVMREQGLRPTFTWLPLTILNPTGFVDHHFLYHVLLIPFTYGDLRTGAKVASVIFPALTFVTAWVLIRGQRVPLPALWATGLFAMSEAFLYRMSMPRAQALSLLMLLLALHVTLSGRYRWLLPLGFIYVWLYDGFPLLLVLVGSYVASRLLLDRKFEVRPLVYAALGVGLGLVINPYFPNNLVFIYHHLLPKLTETTAVRVGNEWYPYRTWTLVENSGPALVAFVAGAFGLALRERRLDGRSATHFFLAVIFAAMLFKSRRFVEYFPAFALVFAATAWKPLLQSWLSGAKGRAWLALPLDKAVASGKRFGAGTAWRTTILAAGMLVLLVPAIWFNVQAGRESLRDTKPYQRYAAASTWLATNSPAGSLVFQTDWDDFTRLFFYNTSNTYTAGLDPTYLQLYDSKLYELWVDISQGRVERPAQTIVEAFGAGYIITDLNHKGFLGEAGNDPQLVEVYRDEYAVVFEITSQGDQ